MPVLIYVTLLWLAYTLNFWLKGYISTPEQLINVLIPYIALMLPFVLIAALAKIDSMRKERKEVK